MKVTLNEQFDIMMNKAIEEMKDYNYKSNKEALKQLKLIMSLFIEDTSKTIFDDFKKKSEFTEKEIEKGARETKKMVYKLLKKRLKMLKNEKIFNIKES